MVKFEVIGKLKQNFGLIGVGVLLVVTSCLDNEPVEPFLTTEASRLLSADTFKIWQIVSRFENGALIDLPGCAEENRQVFNVTTEEDLLDEIGAPLDCFNPASDTLASYSWTLSANLRTEFTDTLQLTSLQDGSTDFRLIELLTSQQLQWSYDQDVQGQNTRVTEIYTAQ